MIAPVGQGTLACPRATAEKKAPFNSTSRRSFLLCTRMARRGCTMRVAWSTGWDRADRASASWTCVSLKAAAAAAGRRRWPASSASTPTAPSSASTAPNAPTVRALFFLTRSSRAPSKLSDPPTPVVDCPLGVASHNLSQPHSNGTCFSPGLHQACVLLIRCRLDGSMFVQCMLKCPSAGCEVPHCSKFLSLEHSAQG